MSYIAKTKSNMITDMKTSHVSSITEQVPTTTYSTVTGSEITYTPDSNATWVVYDIQFTAHSRTSNHVGVYGALVYEDSGSDVAFEYIFTGDGYNDGGYLLRYKFLIPVYSGSRVWKFQTRWSYGASWSQDYHEDEDGNKYFPVATMYSIT